MLNGKKILLGVTGSIAAYKAAVLTRLLVKNGAQVKIICTPDALKFITPLTLSTLSNDKVYSSLADEATGLWTNHVELGMWADLMLIAPCSANTLAKMALGLADNLLLTTYLSARCPVMIAPAMDLDMYAHEATQHNIQLLIRRGHHIIEPATGFLASGLEGKGRLEEPEHIIERLQQYFAQSGRFTGKTVLITAGPTHEAIDPVRFIGNHSSGKMGYAFANAFAAEGAKVILVHGPGTATPPRHHNIHTIPVTTALEMMEACAAHHPQVDVAVFTAAVADYRPVSKANQKIKKAEQAFQLELVKNPDIAQTLGQQKKANQFHLGFSLETEKGIANARKKLLEKNFDAILLNMADEHNAPFGSDYNTVEFITMRGDSFTFNNQSKVEIAQKVVNLIYEIR